MSPQQVLAIANSLALVSWIIARHPARETRGNQCGYNKARSRTLRNSLHGNCRLAVLALSWRLLDSCKCRGAVLQSLAAAGWMGALPGVRPLIGSWEVEDSRERGIPQVAAIYLAASLSPQPVCHSARIKPDTGPHSERRYPSGGRMFENRYRRHAEKCR